MFNLKLQNVFKSDLTSIKSEFIGFQYVKDLFALSNYVSSTNILKVSILFENLIFYFILNRITFEDLLPHAKIVLELFPNFEVELLATLSKDPTSLSIGMFSLYFFI